MCHSDCLFVYPCGRWGMATVESRVLRDDFRVHRRRCLYMIPPGAVAASVALAATIGACDGTLHDGTLHDGILYDHAVRPQHMRMTTPESSPVQAARSPGVQTVAQSFDCKLTAYGPGFESTGKKPGDPGYGITATGKRAQPSRTIAVDPHTIPLGSLVYIDGVGYRVAEDVGGAIRGHHIDIYFQTDGQARAFGVKRHVRVFVYGCGQKAPQAMALSLLVTKRPHFIHEAPQSRP